MKIYIIYSFKLPCPDTESCPVYCEDCEYPRYPICNSLSNLGIGAAQFRSVTEIAPKRNHCSYVWTEALSSMVFAPAQKLSGINSNVDIKAKLTPSAGQVESDAVTVLRANASEFMSFGHSIAIFSHFKTNFTALKRLFHADAHANHVDLLPAASRWMITCLAAVGCFHDLLIIIEESACGWFASTMSICSSSISVCRKERKTVVDL